jgi:hypothetical protein
VPDRCWGAEVILNIPGCELVARNDGGSLGSMNLKPFWVSGPQRC